MADIRAAAKRVDREERTIWRWKAAGLPTVQLNGVNYVALDDLLAWWRSALLANPMLQRHRARLAREDQSAPSPQNCRFTTATDDHRRQ